MAVYTTGGDLIMMLADTDLCMCSRAKPLCAHACSRQIKQQLNPSVYITATQNQHLILFIK